MRARDTWTSVILCAAVVAVRAAPADLRALVAERVMKLTRESSWKRVRTVPLAFTVHHPQGMVRIGDALFVSSVEIRTPTARRAPAADGHDRDPGEGVGHLFKIDMSGHLIADVPLGEGLMYHPGGLDFDGTSIWCPVAEYRPDSRSIVYRIDPATLKVTEIVRVADHIGAIVHNTDEETLHGVSWGSRRFYRWTLDREGRVTNAADSLESIGMLNPSHYVDYQDCKYVGDRRMLCTGVAEMRQAPEAPLVRLGGIDLVSLVDGRPLHQVPVLLWTATGIDMTRNPVWIEAGATGLRGYFMPEDGRSTLYVYDVDTR